MNCSERGIWIVCTLIESSSVIQYWLHICSSVAAENPPRACLRLKNAPQNGIIRKNISTNPKLNQQPIHLAVRHFHCVKCRQCAIVPVHFHAYQWRTSPSEVEEKVKGRRPQRANLLLRKTAKADSARIRPLWQHVSDPTIRGPKPTVQLSFKP